MYKSIQAQIKTIDFFFFFQLRFFERAEKNALIKPKFPVWSTLFQLSINGLQVKDFHKSQITRGNEVADCTLTNLLSFWFDVAQSLFWRSRWCAPFSRVRSSTCKHNSPMQQHVKTLAQVDFNRATRFQDQENVVKFLEEVSKVWIWYFKFTFILTRFSKGI